MKVLPWRLPAALLLLAAAGCTRVDGPPPSSAEAPPHETPAVGETEADPSKAGQVAVRVIDEQELDAVVTGYRGNVVLVDFWATWCLPCLELFPHTVALSERFAGDGLQVISVSLDQPESKSAVLDFLKRHGATFDNFISRYGAGVESMEKFDLPGMLPQLLLYDREGELAHTFPEPHSSVDPDAVDRAVEELLGLDP